MFNKNTSKNNKININFKSKKRFLYPPYSSYHIFYENKIILIDFLEISKKLLSSLNNVKIPLDYGNFRIYDGILFSDNYQLTNIKQMPSDLDQYRLQININEKK